MIKYRIYIVTRDARHHYPVIMSANKKVILNEPVNQRTKLRKSAERFLHAAYIGSEQVEIVEISEADFKAKHPTFMANSGAPKRKAKFKAGAKVTVDAGVWGKCQATVKEQDPKHEDLYYLTITKGPHKGQTGRYDETHITAR